ncbi:MAG: helix-turn-helix domain-containing protein [Ruminococcus sp.]|nr:helix-turn-helix domain-containing protein [Ruminococcus sp.]HOO05890.1 helix-turn-helix domain-containing protein [Ruminococcus sp.]
MGKKKYATAWKEVPVVLDVPYVSVLLGLHPNTVTRLLRTGELKGFKFGNQWRITKDSVMKLLNAEEEEATA